MIIPRLQKNRSKRKKKYRAVRQVSLVAILRGTRKPPSQLLPLEQTDATCTRCDYLGPACVARVHYVRVRVVIHSHVHSPVVTVDGF